MTIDRSRRPWTSATLAIPVLAMAAGCSGVTVSDDAAKADFHYRLARNYYNDHNIAMTQIELHECFKVDPGHAEGHHLKGFMLMGLADLDGAAAEFKEALKTKSDLYEARNNLGTVLIQQGRFSEAIATLKPLTEDQLYPTPAFAHGNLGWAYYQSGDLVSARKHLEMAVFLSPRFCVGYNNLSIVLKEQRNPRGAREALQKAIKACPKYAEAYYHMGVLLQEASEPGASDAFGKCAELAPETTVGKRCLARR